MATSDKFKNRINELISDSEISRDSLLKTLGLSSNTLTNATLYVIIPTPKTLVKLADYFNVTLCYLLGKTNENDFIASAAPSDFKTRFLLLCDEKGVSHYKVSKDCGFESSSIVRWLKNGFTPSLEILDLLCDYFKVSPDYLLGRTDYKN